MSWRRETIHRETIHRETIPRESIQREDIHRGNLILVNPSCPVSTDYFSPHGTVREQWSWELEAPFASQPQHLMQKEAAGALRALLKAAKEAAQGRIAEEGMAEEAAQGRTAEEAVQKRAANGKSADKGTAPVQRIVGVSGYRTMEEQQKIWDDCQAQNGLEYTRTFVAIPGHSEHQTGLAMDVALDQPEIDFICPQFPDEGICAIFRRLAASYGFIERYPAGKEAVTHIGAEPWHFRYVGTPHAVLMQRMNMVLEEYVVWLRQFVWGSNPYCIQEDAQSIRIGYLPFREKDGEAGGQEQHLLTDILPAGDGTVYEISGDNMDGFIITQKCGRQKV